MLVVEGLFHSVVVESGVLGNREKSFCRWSGRNEKMGQCWRRRGWWLWWTL